MGKGRKKRLERPNSSSNDTTNATIGNNPGPEKKGGVSLDQELEQELERRIAYVKAMSDMETEQLSTSVDLLRSQHTEEQLQTPVLQFVRENLPGVSIVRNSDGHFELQRKEENGNLATHNTSQQDVHASLLHYMGMAIPSCSNTRESCEGYQFSGKVADDFQIGNYMPQESYNSLMLQTPGDSIQRLSIGMTPKTQRLPKPGEMLLSVHGSPLGVCKEDNMEVINESEEG